MSEKTLSKCLPDVFLEIFKPKWTMFVLYEISRGNNHFGKLLRAIPEINTRSLANVLLNLEAQNIIIKNVISNKPLEIEYLLTEKGLALRGIFEKMKLWCDRYHS